MEHLARATRIALFVQKVSLILCYQPLNFFLQLIFTPWFFLFDYLCVEVLKIALKSDSRWKKYPAVFVSVLLILCSTAFACAYYETKAELDWHWAIEVFKDWQLYRLFVARGIYNFMGVLLVFIPLTLGYHYAVKYYNSRMEQENEAKLNLLMHDVKNNADYAADFQEKMPAGGSYTRGRKLLILGAIFVPGLFLVFFEPWTRLSATLLWDIVKMLVLMVVPHHLGGNPPPAHPAAGVDGAVGGSSSFYDPKKDPYYVSNFMEDLDPKIKESLQKVAETGGFTNIIHIALESMRADVFPYEKDGLLDQSIKDEKLMDINSDLLTPFLNSIKEHTLSFDNMKATVAYTHKSMLGYFCGQLPLAVDFTREVLEGSTMYQTCWPNVLRQLSALEDENPDELNFLNDDKYKVKTQKWSTANIAAFTGQWDHTHQIFRKAGFETIIDGENILKVLPPRGHNFDIGWGFHDEYSVKTFWKYVDQFQKKAPRNRMLISWMGTTTHEPFDLNPHWTDKYYKEYIQQPEDRRVSLNKYLNGVHWSDMLLKEIIEGFRERGLEDSTLFVVHGDHGFPWIGAQKTPVRDSHNEVYNIPFLVYNPRINNPGGKKIPGDHYSLGIPSTILDLLVSTNSFPQEAQKNYAKAFAQRYEYAQSFLRPMKTVNRMFFVNPGAQRWIIDNGHNLRVLFSIDGDFVRLLDYLKDPVEVDVLESYAGINGLIRAGAEEKFGKGTNKFLKEAYKRHLFMKTEMPRRYTGQDYLD